MQDLRRINRLVSSRHYSDDDDDDKADGVEVKQTPTPANGRAGNPVGRKRKDIGEMANGGASTAEVAEVAVKRPRRSGENSVVSDRLKQVISDRKAVNPKSG